VAPALCSYLERGRDRGGREGRKEGEVGRGERGKEGGKGRDRGGREGRKKGEGGIEKREREGRREREGEGGRGE